MREREQARPTEHMARDQRDSGMREVEDRVQQRVEAICAGEGVRVALVEREPRGPEFGVAAAGDDGAGGVGPELALDGVEGAD